MTFYIVIIIIITVVLLNALKIAQEQERFAVIKLGKFYELKGPGLLLKLMGSDAEWIRLRLGERGELVSPEFGRFQNKDIPVIVDAGTQIGSMIKIIGFNGKKVLAHLDLEQRRTVICEKCGHENKI